MKGEGHKAWSGYAQMELPRGQEVGGNQMLVKNKPDAPWQASLSYDKHGRRCTNEQEASTSLEWDSPLGLSDQFTFGDVTKMSKNASLSYNLPLGWWNFSYSYSQSDYRSEVQANGFGFKETGDIQDHQL